MISEIEAAILERLTLKVPDPKYVAIDEAHSAIVVPAIEVFTHGGSFTKITQRYKCNVEIFIIVTFQHLQSGQDRRAGLYPVLEAVITALTLQTLGLPIDRLVPHKMENVTLKEEADEGKLVFALEFRTGFILGTLDDINNDDETLGDLMRVGFNYYLKPGDDEPDATDLITLREP